MPMQGQVKASSCWPAPSTDEARARADAVVAPLAALLSSIAGHKVVLDTAFFTDERRGAMAQALQTLEPSVRTFQSTHDLPYELDEALGDFEREQPMMGFTDYALKTLLKNRMADAAQKIGREAGRASRGLARPQTLQNATWAALEATMNLVKADIDQISLPDLQSQLQMGLADGYVGLLQAAASPGAKPAAAG
jgi:hypothetical protein